MECIGLRYFNIFGPRQDPNGPYAAVIPKFLNLLKQNKQPTINGDGSFSRDFTYIDNAVQANILALTTKNKECFGEVFNIGAGGQNTLNQLVQCLKFELKSDINPIYGTNRKGDIPHSNADISKAQKIMADDGVTLVLGGDGSIEEGSFHESLLMFKSLKLSGMIIIENNGWSMSTRIQERRAPLDLEKFLMSYNIKYEKLEGNDPYDYIKKLSNLRKDSLKAHEPICIEVNVTTLGDWRMKTPELPDGKFINYHAGPTPSIDIKNWPNTIRENNEDPLFVLKEYFEHSEFDDMLNEIKNEITKEIS